jgi:hypothetical protein
MLLFTVGTLRAAFPLRRDGIHTSRGRAGDVQAGHLRRIRPPVRRLVRVAVAPLARAHIHVSARGNRHPLVNAPPFDALGAAGAFGLLVLDAPRIPLFPLGDPIPLSTRRHAARHVAGGGVAVALDAWGGGVYGTGGELVPVVVAHRVVVVAVELGG